MKRIRESLAVSSLIAASVALNVAWIDNLLIHRSSFVYGWFNLNPAIGPISGLYLDVLGAYFVTLFVALALLRGRDVSKWRDRVMPFLALSIVLFFILTLPAVFGLALA